MKEPNWHKDFLAILEKNYGEKIADSLRERLSKNPDIAYEERFVALCRVVQDESSEKSAPKHVGPISFDS